MIRIRASQLSNIMTDPKDKNEKLSVGAKTYLEKMAKEFVYGFSEVITSKYMDKGIIVEPASIALYNEVHFTDYQKNVERKNNDWLTGECDIFTGSKVIDVKSSWSLPTFPSTKALAEKSAKEAGYDWQGRAYLMLWEVEDFEVAYCMVSTPDELIKYEQEDLHYVDHINPALRVTTAPIYKRDRTLEDKIKYRVDAANEYLSQLAITIQNDHGI